MKLEQAKRYFSERWTLRTGDKSEFSHSNSPFVREGWLYVRGLPGQLVDLLLGSVRCERGPDTDRAGQEQTKSASGPVLWPAVLSAPAYGIAASFLPIPSVVNALVLAVLAAVSVYWILRAAKKQERDAAAENRSTEHNSPTWPEIDESVMESALEESEAVMTALIGYLRGIEEDTKRGHDVTKDKLFGQWIQKLYLYAVRHADDRGLRVLKEELTDVLLGMGIYVYDEIILDKEGKPDLPDKNYYVDERVGEAFTQVKTPVVYSRRKLLAQGRLK